MAIAPYFGVEGDIKDVDVPGAGPQVYFDKLSALIDGQIAKWVAEHQATARYFNVQLVAYEGGNHLDIINDGVGSMGWLIVEDHLT